MDEDEIGTFASLQYLFKYHVVEENDITLFKQAVIQMTSGACAGCLECVSLHSVDVIKTRLQLQKKQMVPTNHPRYYNGFLDCMYKMYVQEGIFSYTKGIFPPLLFEIPRNAVKFFMVEQYLNLFTFDGKRTIVTYYLAGLAAGLTEAPLMTPFELIKVKQQAKVGEENKTMFEYARQIIKKYGLRGLMRGYTATSFRESIYSFFYFGFTMSNTVEQVDSKFERFFRDAKYGFIGGILAAVFNTPFDVVKSRIQAPQKDPSTADYTTIGTIKKIYRRDGLRSFYTGLGSRLVRLGFGGPILFVTYDRVNELMTKLVNG